MCHSLHIQISTCNSPTSCRNALLGFLKGTIESQVPQELVGTPRHVDTVNIRVASAFLYDNTVAQSCPMLRAKRR